ncbi:MAG TPA: hypothetical protein VMB50_18445 [Myxococcales bacterium]|nr:hypothetical protein [Myxococcales bacterium]
MKRALIGLVVAAGCQTAVSGPPGMLSAQLVNTRFEVADHMRASWEMQLSGEPFATLLGYNLAGFNRTLTVTDQYSPDGGSQYVTDPLGYTLAVETYEYSKQPMNNLSFESGAGLSLQFGPLINPQQQVQFPAYYALADRFQQFAAESQAGGYGACPNGTGCPAGSYCQSTFCYPKDAGTGTGLVASPPAPDNPLNPYGWPGLWPVFAEFRSFDPTIQPNPGSILKQNCVLDTGALAYGSAAVFQGGTLLVANYECDYNSLNLPDRDAQVDKTLTPDAMGYATLKQGIWSINYWGTLHDSAGNPITSVAPSDMASVGQPGNQVIGQFADPTDPTGQRLLSGTQGVYLGDIPMEGWQGLTMQEETANKAAFLLGSFLTADGVNLTGASSVLLADQYSYDSPLLYFPAAVQVTEAPTVQDDSTLQDDIFFPKPTSFTISDGSSQLAALSGLIAGFGEAFAMTDQNNPQVGGSVPFLATYDGDPFPPDDGLPDGESTLHDRALGILKIALVDLDRLHFDPVNQVLVDSATVSNGAVTLGTHVTTVELVEAILALRNAYRGLNGTLQLYSNDTPDTQGVASALDTAPLTGATYQGTLEAHLTDLIRAEADFLSVKLVGPSGSVANGYDLSAEAADGSATDIASELAAIRGLLDAYLATSDNKYRELATVVYADLQQRFWMNDVRCFETTAGVTDLMQYTPLRFGFLTGALRQYYKLVASSPAQQGQGAQLLAELVRSYKLVLNGWDDRNEDDVVQYPDECLATGMEMAERALTGELGHPQDEGDRDHDCVKELSYRGLPAALGAELDIRRTQ